MADGRKYIIAKYRIKLIASQAKHHLVASLKLHLYFKFLKLIQGIVVGKNI